VEKEEAVEQFASLSAVGACRHAFIKRIRGVDVLHDKAGALKRLDRAHHEIRDSLGLADLPLATAQQVHGSEIRVLDSPVSSDRRFDASDGFITNQRRLALGVYVADCCAVYLVDPVTPAIGLVHSGKKGTELNIVGRAVEQMSGHFRSDPSNLVVQLSPCIRPPHYEIDFAAEIRRQCRARGVLQIHDAGACTACDLEVYYSYRMEKGKTGRMLALLALG
jgi:copper oxidase (laccase) domain-containing protein